MQLIHSDRLQIGIEGTLHEVEEICLHGYLPMVSVGNGREYYVATDHGIAGQAAREYWEDLAQDDPSEFACLVGKDTLVAWALGQSAGPGSTHVSSLYQWLELVATCPEEQWASYDMLECEVTAMSTGLVDELGWSQPDWEQIIEESEITEAVSTLDLTALGLVEFDFVAYRHN